MINVDVLSEDFLATNSMSADGCQTKNNIKLCGTNFGTDQTTQFITIISGDYIRITRQSGQLVDFRFKSDVGKTLYIDGGKPYLIEINDPAGGTKINVKQGD